MVTVDGAGGCLVDPGGDLGVAKRELRQLGAAEVGVDHTRKRNAGRVEVRPAQVPALQHRVPEILVVELAACVTHPSVRPLGFVPAVGRDGCTTAVDGDEITMTIVAVEEDTTVDRADGGALVKPRGIARGARQAEWTHHTRQARQHFPTRRRDTPDLDVEHPATSPRRQRLGHRERC